MTNKKPNESLLPCPFCASTDVKIVICDGVHFAQCRKCEATGPTGFKRGDEDDADWNTRAQPADQQGEPVALTVWYGAMPESNGKSNFTAILHRKGSCISEGICIDRSEYPERTRYEAERMLFLIGEREEEPDILAYDADIHSGYVRPVQPATAKVDEREAFEEQSENEGANIDKGDDGDYVNPYVQCCWEGWQARAKLKGGQS